MLKEPLRSPLTSRSSGTGGEPRSPGCRSPGKPNAWMPPMNRKIVSDRGAAKEAEALAVRSGQKICCGNFGAEGGRSLSRLPRAESRGVPTRRDEGNPHAPRPCSQAECDGAEGGRSLSRVPKLRDEGNPHAGRVSQPLLFLSAPLFDFLLPCRGTGSAAMSLKPDQGNRRFLFRVGGPFTGSVVRQSNSKITGNSTVEGAVRTEQEITGPAGGERRCELHGVPHSRCSFGTSLPGRKRWCGRWDSNPHAFRHRPLKTACLPVPPLPHSEKF